MALARAPSLATFCSNSSVRGIEGATYAGYALSCPCWCSLYTPPQLPLSVNWTASGRLTSVKGTTAASATAFVSDAYTDSDYFFFFKIELEIACA